MNGIVVVEVEVVVEKENIENIHIVVIIVIDHVQMNIVNHLNIIGITQNHLKNEKMTIKRNQMRILNVKWKKC